MQKFYLAEEVADVLGITVDQIADLVKQGKLREFRDAGKLNYKVDDVQRLKHESLADAVEVNKVVSLGTSRVCCPPKNEPIFGDVNDEYPDIPWDVRDRCKLCNGYITLLCKCKRLCPTCGHLSKFPSDDTYKEVGKWVPTGKWWQFWKKKEWRPKNDN